MFKDKAVHDELTRLVSQIQITDTYISFRDKKHNITNGNALTLLTNLLYSECYMLKESYQSASKGPDFITVENTGFIKLLSQNNHTKEKTEQDWIVIQSYSNGYVEVKKNNESRIVPASSIKVQSVTEQTVSVFFSKEDPYRQPTFYYAFSNELMDMSQKLVRVYWNCTSEGAPVLLNSLTTRLNHYNMPFLFKCLNHPGLYFRRDSGVLYIGDSLIPLLELILPEICTDMESYLEQDVPLFSYHYSKGTGIAEDPDVNESFGMNRMAIVAEALLTSSFKKLQPEETIREIAAAFSKKSISPLATYLNKGSKILFN